VFNNIYENYCKIRESNNRIANKGMAYNYGNTEPHFPIMLTFSCPLANDDFEQQKMIAQSGPLLTS
jgi:hypothetical protein